MPFLHYIQRGTPPSEAPDKQNNQPHVVPIHDLDEEESDVCGQYFIAIEQTLMLENSNIFAAIFYLIAAHYIFNVQYHAKALPILLFLQEKVPSTNIRRTPTTLTHFTGISRKKLSMEKKIHVVMERKWKKCNAL